MAKGKGKKTTKSHGRRQRKINRIHIERVPLAPFPSNESCARTPVRKRFLAQKTYGYSVFTYFFARAVAAAAAAAALLLFVLLLLAGATFSARVQEISVPCLLPPASFPTPYIFLSPPLHPSASARVKEFARARCPCSLLSYPPPQILRCTHTPARSRTNSFSLLLISFGLGS